MKRLLFLLSCTFASMQAMDTDIDFEAFINTPPAQHQAPQLWNVNGWEDVQTLTPADIIQSLRVISRELTRTKSLIDQHAGAIPAAEREIVGSLIEKWLSDTQAYLDGAQMRSEISEADRFLTIYFKQEAAIGRSVQSLEYYIANYQAPEDALAELINGLSISGQVQATDDALIGALENLSLD